MRRPYTAPERIAGGDWDRRADVFSLAMLTHELLWARRVSGLGATRRREHDRDPRSGSGALRVAFARALAEDPASRFETALEFAEALRGAFSVAEVSEELPVASDLAPIVSRQSPVVSHKAPTAGHQPPVVSREAPAISRQAPVVGRESAVTSPPSSARPAAQDKRPVTDNRRPTTDDRRPKTDDRRPTTDSPRFPLLDSESKVDLPISPIDAGEQKRYRDVEVAPGCEARRRASRLGKPVVS